MRRVRDFAIVKEAESITEKIAADALRELGVDDLGLDELDQRYLRIIGESFSGGPVGIETIAASLFEPRDAIEDIIEPFLMQKGFVRRSPRGRILTDRAFEHMGLAVPEREQDDSHSESDQENLFNKKE